MAASYQFGIEEELFLADAATRSTPDDTRPFHRAVKERLPDVERELLASQVEIMTRPCTGCPDARTTLTELRGELVAIGRDHGILVLGGGTHPLAHWRRQDRTDKRRYDEIADDLQILAGRDVVSGMHVHVEVPDPATRVDLMNRLLPHTPLLFALSASSPFWEGRQTGLNAYRLSVWGEMPRTGLPQLFADTAEYDRLVAAMTRGGAIEDASFFWWTMRPSIRFPTLELRVADSCTRLDDTLAVAALYRCLVRHADRDRTHNAGLTAVSRVVAEENMWRAQRDGVGATFLREGGETVSYPDLLAEVLELVADDADALGCQPELERARWIAADGTSADRQLAIFAHERRLGASNDDALKSVVTWMADAIV